MSFQVQFHADALSDLKRLDKGAAQRILSKIRWFAGHFEDLAKEALSGELADFFKLRIGSYRAIYTVDEEQKTMTVHRIGHRKDIYR